jgi:hypothetical protein
LPTPGAAPPGPGVSEKEAADGLNLSYHTVHTHVKQIYRELGVRSRGELVAMCLSPAGVFSVDGADRTASDRSMFPKK